MAKHQLRFHVSLLFLLILVTSTLAARKAIKQQRRQTSASHHVQHYNTHGSSINGAYNSGANVARRPSSLTSRQQPNSNTRQIQQWQIAVNVPPGSLHQSSNSPSPPSPALPGHIWIQVPVSNGAAYPAQGPPPQIQPVPAPVSSPQQPAAPEHVHQQPQPQPEQQPEQQPFHPGSETFENEIAASGPADIDSDPEKLKNCVEARGQFASPTDCTKFYNCWDGFVAEQSCPNGLAFSDQGPFCDYIENVDCSQRGGSPPAPAPEPEQPQQQGGGSEESGGGDNTIHEQEGQYEQGQYEEGQYEEGQYEEGQYEEGEQVSEQEVAEDVGAGCAEPYSRYRSPKHCDVFIVCDNRVPIRFKCPATLHYNEELGICDYPYRVDCGASSPSESSVLAPSPPDNGLEGEEPAEAAGPMEVQIPEDVLRYYGGFAKRPPVPHRYFRQG